MEKTNHFLIQDSSENRFAGLLTNGSDTVLTTPTNVHADPEPKSRMATNENVEDRSKGHNLERGSNLKSTHSVVSNSVATPYVTSGYVQYQSTTADTKRLPYLPTQPRPSDSQKWSPLKGLSSISSSSSSSLSSIGHHLSNMNNNNYNSTNNDNDNNYYCYYYYCCYYYYYYCCYYYYCYNYYHYHY